MLLLQLNDPRVSALDLLLARQRLLALFEDLTLCMLQLRHQDPVPFFLLLDPLVPLPVQRNVILGLLEHALLQLGDDLGLLLQLPVSALDQNLASPRDLVEPHLHRLHLLLWMRWRGFLLHLLLSLLPELRVFLNEAIEALLRAAKLLLQVLIPSLQLLTGLCLLLHHYLDPILQLPVLLLFLRDLDLPWVQLLFILFLHGLQLSVQLLDHLLEAFPHPVNVVAVGLLFGAKVVHELVITFLLDFDLLLEGRIVHLGELDLEPLLLDLELLDLLYVGPSYLVGLSFDLFDLDLQLHDLPVVLHLGLLVIDSPLLRSLLQGLLEVRDLLLDALRPLLCGLELLLALFSHGLDGFYGLLEADVLVVGRFLQLQDLGISLRDLISPGLVALVQLRFKRADLVNVGQLVSFASDLLSIQLLLKLPAAIEELLVGSTRTPQLDRKLFLNCEGFPLLVAELGLQRLLLEPVTMLLALDVVLDNTDLMHQSSILLDVPLFGAGALAFL
mmetsp:Transcript_68391/g.160361  ORF Transcript_68391/g.160361 Transcript_68391/m.160361 type:complete len:501 (+) Transcript_68391:1789-3291(+)